MQHKILGDPEVNNINILFTRDTLGKNLKLYRFMNSQNNQNNTKK